MKSGSRTCRAYLLSHAIVMLPAVMLKCLQMVWTIMTMPYSPDSSHRWESPSRIGPGTWLAPMMRWVGVGPSMAKAAVPKSSFNDPSSTPMARPSLIAWAMVDPSSVSFSSLNAHLAESGRFVRRSWRVSCGGGIAWARAAPVFRTVAC